MPGQVIPMHVDQIVVEDQTERALHRIIDCAADFGHALARADRSARCVQLSQRIGVAIELLMQVQDAAMAKANRL